MVPEWFKKGLQPLLEAPEGKLRELDRYARVSFSLESKTGSSDILTLNHCLDFSRCAMVFPKYSLGSLHVKDGYCHSSDMRTIGRTLRDIVAAFETMPDKEQEKWIAESFNGEGRQLVPLAVHGIGYFSGIVDEKGIRFAPKELLTYRSDDPVSLEFLKYLAG